MSDKVFASWDKKKLQHTYSSVKVDFLYTDVIKKELLFSTSTSRKGKELFSSFSEVR